MSTTQTMTPEAMMAALEAARDAHGDPGEAPSVNAAARVGALRRQFDDHRHPIWLLVTNTIPAASLRLRRGQEGLDVATANLRGERQDLDTAKAQTADPTLDPVGRSLAARRAQETAYRIKALEATQRWHLEKRDQLAAQLADAEAKLNKAMADAAALIANTPAPARRGKMATV